MQPKRKSKYNARRTECNGRMYASKAEARYAFALPFRQRDGEILYWLEQVPIRLPGGVKYVVDFVVFHADKSVHYVDVKGAQTAMFKLKKKQVEALYPITIEVVK